LHVGADGAIKKFNSLSNGSLFNINAVSFDASGNYVLTGFEDSKVFVQKYSDIDVEVWRRTFDGPANLGDAGVDVKTDVSGNAYVLAKCWFNVDQSNVSTEDFIIKYSPNGDLPWPQSGGAYFHGGLALEPNVAGNPGTLSIDSVGSVYAAGNSHLGGTWDGFVSKVSETMAPCGLTFSAPFISTGTSTGTVWLSKPAPVGGQLVSTGCANPYAQRTPLGFVIPEGAF